MSANNPIPVRLRPSFFAFMDAHDHDDMPDGAWFATLETAAQQFIDKHKLRFACNNSAAHQYLRQCEEASAKVTT
jgi:hypothetical protein